MRKNGRREQMAYRYALFDLYGTLIDIHTDEDDPSLWQDFYQWLSQELSRQQEAKPRISSAHDLEQAFHQEEDKEKASHLSKEARGVEDWEIEIDLEPVYRRLLSRFGFSDDLLSVPVRDGNLIARAAAYFRQRSRNKFAIFPKAHEFLSRLRADGVMTVLASNAQLLFTRQELAPLVDGFDRIFISSQVGYKKPSARFYRHILENAASGEGGDSLDSGEGVMIGNEVACDILGARGVGLDGILLRTGTAPWLSEGPDSAKATLSLQGADYPAAYQFITGHRW